MASLGQNCFLVFLFTFSALLCQVTSRLSYNNDDEMSIQHKQWMAQHKRNYKSNEEKLKRFKIFKDNVEFIKSFNKAGKNKYKLGINEFADLTNEEFVAKYTGAKIPSLKRSSITPFTYGNVKDVAPSLDWRDRGAVTTVENQGGCGSCWAFSAVAAIEGITQIKTGKLVSLSEQQLLDCMTTTDSCKGGWMEHAFEFATQNQGLDSDTDYPYQAKQGTCSANKPSSLPAMITGHQSVPTNNETALLMDVSNQPVCVRIDPSQMRFYKNGILTGDCGTHLTHAITAVGYDTSEDGTKYWIFKNSWGPNWGENGFIRIQRDIAAKEGMCGIAMYPTFPIV